MLAGLALKRRWQHRRRTNKRPADSPNIVFSSACPSLDHMYSHLPERVGNSECEGQSSEYFRGYGAKITTGRCCP